MAVTLQFIGGADSVTGSKYLVCSGTQSLLVDCGLFQGFKQLRLRNWDALPVAPDSVDAVILTHAHLDHSGYVPKLQRDGFAGRVHVSPGTRDLCKILWPDSGHLQEEDAFYANRHGFSKHSPAEPLYDRQDAVNSLALLQSHPWGEAFSPMPGWRATFSSAGHILGASSLLLEVGERRILFSGDLGRPDDLIMKPPQDPPAADTVLIESTYGNRVHPHEDALAELAPALQRAAARSGVVVIPVFAVGRAQAILHAIATLKAQGLVPHHLPIYLDSPMAVHTTDLFRHHPDGHRLSPTQMQAMQDVAVMVESVQDSKALAKRHGPKVILSASGMATGGRVLHHLALYLPDHRNMVILTGYQAPGTRGASLASGQPSVRIHGRDVGVKAEVVCMASASAHADSVQLLQWLSRMPKPPGQVYVVHGEAAASDALRWKIEHELGWRARVPDHLSVWPL
jgi:metallo-beta-lactamase family protein